MKNRQLPNPRRWLDVAFWPLLVSLAATLACQKTYYTALETVGVEKRELLSTRVEKAKESQQEAQETFRDALERFQKTTGHEGGALERRYDDLRDAYEDSKDQAEEVSARIDSVEDVGSALLEEWEQELDEYEDETLKQNSAEQLASTRNDFEQLLTAMRHAEESLEPVLTKLNDRVLYLKHNLNAQALESLDARLPELERDVERLIAEMESSIAKADQFMKQLG